MEKGVVRIGVLSCADTGMVLNRVLRVCCFDAIQLGCTGGHNESGIAVHAMKELCMDLDNWSKRDHRTREEVEMRYTV